MFSALNVIVVHQSSIAIKQHDMLLLNFVGPVIHHLEWQRYQLQECTGQKGTSSESDTYSDIACQTFLQMPCGQLSMFD